MLHQPARVGAWQVSAVPVLAVAEPEIWVCKPVWRLSKGIIRRRELRRRDPKHQRAVGKNDFKSP